MVDDYRNTKYCPRITKLVEKKKDIKNAILEKHTRAQDMHKYISKNDEPFKEQFVKAYNGKCAYCGVSCEIIPLKMFEIDHFIPKTSVRFNGSKAKAGCIDNLVLSCYDCNRAKGAFECSDEELYKIHPDDIRITDSFIRDEEYYIKIKEKMKNDSTINSFYEIMEFGSQLRRIDYLLMNMRGLSEKIMDIHPAHVRLEYAIDLLQKKRNIMR